MWGFLGRLVRVGVLLAWTCGAAGTSSSLPSASFPAASLPALDGLGGIVRAPDGSALADVELLVFAPQSGPAPLARLTTDVEGRFRVPTLSEGTYRVAALKEGYGTVLAMVDLMRRRPVELILRPESLVDDARREQLPRTPAWALRLPVRHPWRERSQDWQDAEAPVAEGAIHGRVDQSMSLGLDRIGAGSRAVGHETGLVLAGALDAATQLRFDGRSRRLGRDDDPLRARHDSLEVSLDHSEEAYGAIAVRAFYDRSHPFALGSFGAATDEPARDRHWGYDASWSHSVDSEHQWEVHLGYRGLGWSPASDAEAESFGPEQRRVGAAGRYESLVVPGHRIRVDFHADYAGGSLESATGPTQDHELRSGWVFGLRASDAVAVSPQWTVLYGLGLTQFSGGGETAVLAPHVGAAWLRSGVRVEGEMTWHEARAGDPETPGPFAERADRRAGFLGAVEAPVGSIVLRLQTRSTPFELSWDGVSNALPRPTALTTGETDVREHSWSARHEQRLLNVGLEWAEGAAAGHRSLRARYGDLAAWGELVPVSYRRAAADVASHGTGTSVHLEWNRLEEPRDAGSWIERSLELRLAQELPAELSGAGPFELLVAWRRSRLSEPSIESPRLRVDELRSGVQVRF